MSKYYATTSIPYVNADPHIGFAMELLYGDVLARRARLQGLDVIYSTGTDEHGGKIAEKAAEQGVDIKQFTDQVSKRFQELGKLLNISNNRFIRTTDPGHEQRAKLIWKSLKKDIYKGKYTGWYCTGDEAFFTETEVKTNNGVCPNHNRPYEKIEEENYFFKLSAYGDAINKAIMTGEFLIVPETRRNEILNIIQGGLEDISISRPKEKIGWGIPVPGDAKQVMYVWFEALMNYITVLGYPEHDDFKQYWPADAQIIGKDIIRFHAAVWPAMLMSLKLPLPKQLYVHGFITVEGKKMSKTIGNVIHPADVISKYGVDAFRYYFLRHVPSYEDGDFSWQRLEASYNNELANELGNAVQRTAAMIVQYQDKEIGELPESGHDIAKYEEALAVCRFDRALDEVWEQVRGLNQYIDEEKPWEIAKQKDADHLREVLAYQVSSLLSIATLLEPFLPETASRIQAAFKDGTVTPIEGTLFPKHDDAKN
ncbi:methionine--tRNA ligase [Candidatus Saccharibacteria bacterium CG_4_10_14_0_2_um_filter_52_9]|nr:MAG: methionine--tRNA ligase [Candidatus Saccharibacteria bacterium CG_4_10_14_0_2_um_filter_52_9]